MFEWIMLLVWFGSGGLRTVSPEGERNPPCESMTVVKLG